MPEWSSAERKWIKGQDLKLMEARRQMAMAARRLLVDFRYGIGPARLVSRCPAGRSLRRLPTDWVWLSSGLRPRRAPWRGVAPEGTARLKVALPVLAVIGHCQAGGSE